MKWKRHETHLDTKGNNRFQFLAVAVGISGSGSKSFWDRHETENNPPKKFAGFVTQVKYRGRHLLTILHSSFFCLDWWWNMNVVSTPSYSNRSIHYHILFVLLFWVFTECLRISQWRQGPSEKLSTPSIVKKCKMKILLWLSYLPLALLPPCLVLHIINLNNKPYNYGTVAIWGKLLPVGRAFDSTAAAAG